MFLIWIYDNPFLLQLLRWREFTATATLPGRRWGEASWWRSSSSRPWRFLCGSASQGRGNCPTKHPSIPFECHLKNINFSFHISCVWMCSLFSLGDFWWPNVVYLDFLVDVKCTPQNSCSNRWKIFFCHFLEMLLCTHTPTKTRNTDKMSKVCVLHPQPPSSVRGDSSQQRLRGQTGRQGGSEGEGGGRRRAVDPGWGGQLQPLHQQVSWCDLFQISGFWPSGCEVWRKLSGNQFSVLKQIWLFFSSPCRYEVDDIDEEGKEWVLFNSFLLTSPLFFLCSLLSFQPPTCVNKKSSFREDLINQSQTPNLQTNFMFLRSVCLCVCVCLCDQETHSEQTADHPSASVEGQPRDGPRGPVQQGPAGAGPLSPDHLLLPGPHPHSTTQGETLSTQLRRI